MRILFVSKNFKCDQADLGTVEPHELVMMVDADRCISCGACELACQVEHGGQVPNFDPAVRRIRIDHDSGRSPQILNLPLSCRHCESPCEFFNEYNFWTTCPASNKAPLQANWCDGCAERVQSGLMAACATRCTMKCIYFGRAADVAFALGEKRLRDMGSVDLSR